MTRYAAPLGKRPKNDEQIALAEAEGFLVLDEPLSAGGEVPNDATLVRVMLPQQTDLVALLNATNWAATQLVDAPQRIFEFDCRFTTLASCVGVASPAVVKELLRGPSLRRRFRRLFRADATTARSMWRLAACNWERRSVVDDADGGRVLPRL